MGGHGLPKIPNYKIYQWERIPELVKVQDRLAAHGLKDPWIRNEVWRWHPGYGTVKSRSIQVWTRGMFIGAVLAVITWQYQKWYTNTHPEHTHWHDPDSLVERYNREHPEHAHGGHREHGHGHH